MGNRVVFAQGKRDNGGITIEHVGQIESHKLPKSIAEKWDSALKSTIKKIFRQIQQQLVFPDFTFHLTLPSNWVHYYFLPVEPDLNTEEQKAFLEWEAQQRSGEFARELEFRFFLSHHIGDKNTGLIMAYPQGMLALLKGISKELNLRLETVELDHFVGWSNLVTTGGPQYLCKFTRDTVSISQYEGSVFGGTGIFSADALNRTYRYLRGSVDNAHAKHYQQVLRHLLTGRQSENGIIWIYGSDIPDVVFRLARENNALRLIRPISKWSNQGEQADLANNLEYESLYTEAIGVIRNSAWN